jgi:hypothetical protein
MADPSKYSSGNYPSWYFGYSAEYISIYGSNLTWAGFTKSWIGNANYMQNTGLPSANAYNTGSNRREFQPGNFTITQTGPSTMTLADIDLKCELAYRITSGAFLGFTPTPCKAGKDADCPTNCAAGSAKQQQQPASAGFVCALCPAAGKGSDLQSWKVGVSCGSSTAAAASGPAKGTGHRRRLFGVTQAGSGTEKANSNSKQTGSTGGSTTGNAAGGTIGSTAGGTASITAGSTAGSTTSSTCGGAYKPPAGTSKPLHGSGVLVADSSDLLHPVCKSNKAFAGFAAWLVGKQTWFSYQADELSWKILGSTEGSRLARLPVMSCAGTALGGTHAEPAALTVQSQQLGE